MRRSDEGRWEATRACLDCVRQEDLLGDAQFEVGPEAAPAHPARESRFRSQTPAPEAKATSELRTPAPTATRELRTPDPTATSELRTPALRAKSESRYASPYSYSGKAFKMPTLQSRLPQGTYSDDELVSQHSQDELNSTFISDLYGRDMPSVQAGTEEFFSEKNWGDIPIILLEQHYEPKKYEVEVISTNPRPFETITVLLISLRVKGDEEAQAHAITVFKDGNGYWIFDSLGNDYALKHYGPELIKWVQDKTRNTKVKFIEIPMHNIEYILDEKPVQMCWPFAMYAISVFKQEMKISDFKTNYLKEHTQTLKDDNNKLFVRASKALIKHFVLRLFENTNLSSKPYRVEIRQDSPQGIEKQLFKLESPETGNNTPTAPSSRAASGSAAAAPAAAAPSAAAPAAAAPAAAAPAAA